MEESIAFHDVLPAGHPADVDSRRGEPAAHIVFVAVDASDRTSVEEDADADAPTGGVPEDGCDPLAREGIDAHLDRPFGGREESEQGTVPGIRREDRREAARQLEFAEAERGLSQSMAARALPVLRSIPVDPFAARRAEADRDLAPPHLLRGPGGPPGPGVGRVSPHVGVDHGRIRIEEQDLVAGVREPKDSALHGTRLASVEREIGGRERVLAVTRRIPRDEDAALRGHARIDWEGRRGFAIREGPSGEIERFVAVVFDLDEFVVPHRARVDADQEDLGIVTRRKRGGGGSEGRGEGFDLARRPEGRSGQQERNQEGHRPCSRGTHVRRTSPTSIRGRPTGTLRSTWP